MSSWTSAGSCLPTPHAPAPTQFGHTLIALAAIAWVTGCSSADFDDPPLQLDDRPRLETTQQSVVGAPEESGHRIQVSDCPSPWWGCELAENVPMTGTVSPLFEEVDIAMRQFVRSGCAGGGTLAFSRRNRLVYKRGFGRTQGWAGDSGYGDQHFSNGVDYHYVCGHEDYYDAAGNYFLPDTPLGLGSTTKWLVAAMARELIEKRIDFMGLRWKYSDATEVLLFDQEMGLLPSDLIAIFKGTHPTFCLPPSVAVGADGCDEFRTEGSCLLKPDRRWLDITVGDLIRHSAAIPDPPGFWDEVIPRMGALRLADASNKSAWEAEYQHLAAKTKYPAELATARTYYERLFGVSKDNIFLLDYFGSSAGEHSIDEILKLASGMCMTGAPGGASDSEPYLGSKRYSNFGYDILGRVVAHLNKTVSGGLERAGAETGFPETHPDTALGRFTAANGIARGISSEASVFGRQLQYAPGYQDPMPAQLRHYASGHYYWQAYNRSRPFCVWNATYQKCSFDHWLDDANQYRNRLTWDFQVGMMPFHRIRAGQSLGGGLFGGESAALVKLANRYFALDLSVFQGRKRSTLPPNLATTMGSKNGGMQGSKAWVVQLVGTSFPENLPPLDENNRLTITQGRAGWASQTVQTPAAVDFAVLINQKNSKNWPDDDSASDPDNEDTFDRVSGYVRWGLSRVDWEQVDRMIHHQERHVVGMAMDEIGTYYWYESNGVAEDDYEAARFWYGTPFSHQGDSTPDAIMGYKMPGPRIGTDVVGVAIRNGVGSNPVYTWYVDGHYSVGTGYDLGSTIASAKYTMPDASGVTLKYDKLLGIAFNNAGRVYSWHQAEDYEYHPGYGRRAIGIPGDLDYYSSQPLSTFSVPFQQTVDQIESITIDWANNDHVWTRYRDGSISEGTSLDLDAHGYWPAMPTTMAIANGKTTFYYATGWQRTFSGNPTAITNAWTNQLSSGYWYAGGTWDDGYRDPSDVVGVGQGPLGHVFYADGKGAIVSGANTYGGEFNVNYETSTYGDSADDVVGTGTRTDGSVYTWFKSGYRGQGNALQPHATSRFPYTRPLGYFASMIRAMAVDDNNHVWTIYSNGTISEGTSLDLDYYNLWVNLAKQ